MRKKDILIVEDNDSLYESMEFVLHSAAPSYDVDYALWRATNRNEALGLMRKIAFRVISIDMDLPAVGGARTEPFIGISICVEALLQSRRYKEWQHLIVFSGKEPGHVRERLKEHAICEGMERYPQIIHKVASEMWTKAVLEKMT